MKPPILKLPGSLEEVNIRCPKCNSIDIVVKMNKEGYYEVMLCNKCGYKNPKKLRLFFLFYQNYLLPI